MNAVEDLAAWLTAVWDEDTRRFGGHEEDCDEQFGRPCDCIFGEVLARIAADRAILAEYVARDKDADLMLGPDCERQREWSGLRLALRLKAEQYKSRPGFNPEWLDRSQGSRSHP